MKHLRLSLLLTSCLGLALGAVWLRRRRSLLLALLAAALGAADRLPAQNIDLTSGTSGQYLGGQSFNEMRAIELSVAAWAPVQLSLVTLNGLDLGGATSAFVGARIYLSSSQQLIASADTTVFANGPITLALSAVLAPGETYRIGFYVETSPDSQASGALFAPTQFPYTESSGYFVVRAAYAFPGDAFPAFENLAMPQISVTASTVPEPAPLVGLLGGAIALATISRWRRA